MTKQPFEYYLDLIRNGEVLTDIEISNAKSLHKRGHNKDYESCLAVVRRNREENDNWNDWYYRRYVLTHRTPEELAQGALHKTLQMPYNTLIHTKRTSNAYW
jgi:hypothetical protein